MYSYEKTIDRPEHDLRHRYMRRRGDTATETCTYERCVTFSTDLGRPMFNKDLHHAEFAHDLEQTSGYSTFASYTSTVARRMFMYLWNDRFVQ
eukprot:11741735-Karenia_brevis.AAC.1